MPYFPCVNQNDTEVVFASVTLGQNPVGGRSYMHLPSNTEHAPISVAIDKTLVGGDNADKNAYASVLQAMSLSPNFDGEWYLTCSLDPSTHLGGASLGVAVALALSQHGNKALEGVAFTGFVSNIQRGQCTNMVHDIDKVDVKIRAATERKILLVVPWSDKVEIISRTHAMLTPSMMLSFHPSTYATAFKGIYIGSAYSLSEAILVGEALALANSDRILQQQCEVKFSSVSSCRGSQS
jgi:hypothetical protein